MKRIVIIMGIFLCVLFLNAENIHVFSGLFNPRYIVVNDNQVIISDYPYVYLYSLDDFSLIKKIGREGNGPGEFHVIQANMNLKERGLVLSVCPEHIAANSTSRISYFTKRGEFIREQKLPYGINAKFLSLGDKLLGFLPLRDGVLSVTLFDSDLNTRSEIMNCDYWFNLRSQKQANFFDRAADTLLVSVSNDKIFIARGDALEFAVHVFDFKGNKLYTLEHNTENIRIPPGFVDEIHEHFRVKYNERAEYFIKNLNLPKHFPAIRDFSVADDKIYVFTFEEVSDQKEVIIFNIKGDLVKTSSLPAQEMSPERLSPFSFYKNKFYQLVFNEKTENWELHRTDID